MIRKIVEMLYWHYQEKDNWKMKMNEPVAIQKITKEEAEEFIRKREIEKKSLKGLNDQHIEEKKKNYLAKVYAEMERRELTSTEIPKVINKTGFMIALEKFPEEQLHCDVSVAVDEILLTAARM